jgi:NADH pyrophosphatase NudC (nudix superfamily)|tara:strand:+ start:118 stop:675 length:558 start_codon:yes stop_codon:yes gene_type:complete
MTQPFRFCPQCAMPLELSFQGDRDRLACPAPRCGFVHWDNPTPVVAAIVEHEGQIILARNAAWPSAFYALITGFLERGETPEDGVQREVEEELGLTPQAAHFVGLYEFHRMNQLIIAYHVPATGNVRLNEELADWKHVPFDGIHYWPAGTGYALRDWAEARGYGATRIELPTRMQAPQAGETAQS